MGSVQHLSVLGWRDFAESRRSAGKCYAHDLAREGRVQEGQSGQHPQKLVVPSAWGSSEHVRSISMEEGVSGVSAIWRWRLMRVRHETFQYFLMRDESVRDAPGTANEAPEKAVVISHRVCLDHVLGGKTW